MPHLLIEEKTMTQSMLDKLRHGSRDNESSRREAEQRAEEQRAEEQRAQEQRAQEQRAEAARAEEQRLQEQRERAENAARDAERDSAAQRERLERDAQRREREQQHAVPPEQTFGTSFLADGKTENAWQRWRELQSNFVDDPQSAVKQADGLVTELIDGIVRRFETEREQLERRWSSGQEVSTEDLRRCLQRYRDFFGRLLTNVGEAPAE
jgi:hypothetical protein